MKKIFALFYLVMAFLEAKPEGFQMINGNAELYFPNPQTTVIKADHKAIIHWDSFSIAQDETVRFVLPSQNSRVLNRVFGNQRSEIYGNLESNGHVYLINSEGILFGAESCIHLQNFTVSSFDLCNERFLQGKDKFCIQGTEKIINLGTIQAEEKVVIIGSMIDQEGTICSKQIIVSAEQGNLFLKGRIEAKENARIEGKNITVGALGFASSVKASSFSMVADENIHILGNTHLIATGEEITILCAEKGMTIDQGCHFKVFGELLISSNDNLNLYGSLIETLNNQLSFSSNEAILIEDCKISSASSLRLVAGGPLEFSSKTINSSLLSTKDLFIEADTIDLQGEIKCISGDLQILTCDLLLQPFSSIELADGDGIFRAMIDDCGSLVLFENSFLKNNGQGVLSLTANGEILIGTKEGPSLIQSVGDLDISADGNMIVKGEGTLITSKSGNINLYAQEDFSLFQGVLNTGGGNIDIFSRGNIHLSEGTISGTVLPKGFLHCFAGENISLDNRSTLSVKGENCLALFVADHNYPKTIGNGSFICSQDTNIFVDGTGCIKIYTNSSHPEIRLSTIDQETYNVFYPATPSFLKDLVNGTFIFYKRKK